MRLWKDFIKCVVIKHYGCFISSCAGKKPADADNFVIQFEKDLEFIESYFSGTVFDSSLKTLLKPYEDLLAFI